MSVTFKKILRKSPFDKEGTGKYYPQLITWGKPATLNTIAKQMKEKSSLTLGDIKSVLTNFVEVTRSELYNGHAVNIENFGVFSLSATTVGTDTKKACLPENIRWVRINFRASASVRPNLAATRAEDRLDCRSSVRKPKVPSAKQYVGRLMPSGRKGKRRWEPAVTCRFLWENIR